MNYIVPSTGILPRLAHKIESFVKEEHRQDLTIEKMVNLVEILPRFAQIELWENLHYGNNLDSTNTQWLIEKIEIHSHSYLESESTRVYRILRQIFNKE